MMFRFNVGSKIVSGGFSVKSIPKIPVVGMSSRTFDGGHVLFLDYDLVVNDVVEADLKVLQKYCSHVFIFRSDYKKENKIVKCSYHLVCLDKMFFSDVLDLHKLSHADQSFKDLAKASGYREWVLRIGNKGNRKPPKFVAFYSFNNLERVHSREHYVLLTKLYSELKENKDFLSMQWNFDRKNFKVSHNFTLYNTLKERH